MDGGLRVLTWFSYATSEDVWCGEGKPKEDTYHAKKFVDALKGRRVNGYAKIPVPFGASTRKHLDDTNKREAFAWFGEIAVKSVKIRTSVCLVPVPGSKCTCRDEVKTCGAYKIAEEIASRSGMKVEPVLWWSKQMMSASREGGPRDASVLLPYLQSPEGASVEPKEVLLIDDVKTTGGHLLACEACLLSVGLNVIGALCAGRTVHDEAIEPFSLKEEILPRFRDEPSQITTEI